MSKASKTTGSATPCVKCGDTRPKKGILGNVCADNDCAYVGRHIGTCAHCGFTMLADTDPRCPRCMKTIVLAD